MINWSSSVFQVLYWAQMELSLQRPRCISALQDRGSMHHIGSLEVFHNPNSCMAIQVHIQLGKQFTKWCLKRSDSNTPHSLGKGMEWLPALLFLPPSITVLLIHVSLFQNSKYSLWYDFSGYRYKGWTEFTLISCPS